jgi:hypothetical protein
MQAGVAPRKKDKGKELRLTLCGDKGCLVTTYENGRLRTLALK